MIINKLEWFKLSDVERHYLMEPQVNTEKEFLYSVVYQGKEVGIYYSYRNLNKVLYDN